MIKKGEEAKEEGAKEEEEEEEAEAGSRMAFATDNTGTQRHHNRTVVEAIARMRLQASKAKIR